MSDGSNRDEGNIPNIEILQPVLRRRRMQVVSPTQPADHDYVEAGPRQEPPPSQRRQSIDIFPSDEDVDDDENDDDLDDDALEEEEAAEELLANAPGSSRSNSDHDYAESPPELVVIDPDQPIDEYNDENRPVQIDNNTNTSMLAQAVPASMPLIVEAGTSAAVSVVTLVSDAVTDLTSPSPPSKKRKRLSPGANSGTPQVKTAGKDADDDDEDNGLTCPICLDHWEMSGQHRLVSLRCGHLFGDSCIRRWLAESMKQTSVRRCPQCKSKVANKDIRCLYAKRVRAIDRTEEHRMRTELDLEKKESQLLRTELSTIRMSFTVVTNKIRKLEEDNQRLRDIVRAGGFQGAFNIGRHASVDMKNLPTCRLFMERNFEITKEPGCRVMVYSDQQSSLIASQKSAQQLFPGYGVRFIDVPTFRPLNFLHTSGKIVRDICLSADQKQLVVTSLETRCKLFDLRTRQISAVFSCEDKPIWSCAMDRNEREYFLYLGDQRGSICVYDVRYPDSIVNEFQNSGDFSPVIHISAVRANKSFPGGGFLVCKLMSLWFYEYTNETAESNRLNIEGPFLSMSFDAVQETVLLSTRSNQTHSQSRFILGKLEKLDGLTVFDVKVTFFGSKPTPIMTRAGQIAVDSNTLIVGYLQDTKQLGLYDVRREECAQTLPVKETVYDTCAIHSASSTYLAALTDCKCRIYKVNSSTPI